MGTNGVTFDAGSPLHNLKQLRKEQKTAWKASQKAAGYVNYVNANQTKGINAKQINDMNGIGRARSYNQVQAYARDVEQALLRRDAVDYVNANQTKGINAKQINDMVGIGRARSYNQVQAYARDFEEALNQRASQLPVRVNNTQADLTGRFNAELQRLAGDTPVNRNLLPAGTDFRTPAGNNNAIVRAGSNLGVPVNGGSHLELPEVTVSRGAGNLPVRSSHVGSGYRNIIDVEPIEIKNPGRFSKIFNKLKGKGGLCAAILAAVIATGVTIGALSGKKDEKPEAIAEAGVTPVPEAPETPVAAAPIVEEPVEEVPVEEEKPEEPVDDGLAVREVAADEEIETLDKDAEVKLITLEDLYTEIPAYTFPPRYMTTPVYPPSPVENFNFSPVTTGIQAQIDQSRMDMQSLKQQLKNMKKVERLQRQLARKTDRYNIREMRDAARDEMRHIYQTTELGVAEYKANRAIQNAFYA